MFGKKTILTLLILIVAYVYNSYLSKPPQVKSPVIETKSGKLEGIVSVSRIGRLYYEFLGIPYAQPPVGNLRLEPPLPVSKWEGIKDASAYGPVCAQLQTFTNKVFGEEDCLSLNIFAPVTKDKLLPVMVWLHGGAFISGSSQEYKPKYFMDENVILVTLNYRLGALGFMNTGDGSVRGNMGLKDQSLALKWVNKNIQSFGGDPQQVTIFGESAGSASTCFQLLSPMSKGLFSKAILHSGESTANWAIHKNHTKQADTFAQEVGCLRDNKKEMVNCLKALSTYEFVKGHVEVRTPLEPNHLFVPTIETVQDANTFISEHPLKILKSGKLNTVPIIIGMNSHEGLLTASVMNANQSRLDEANDNFYQWAGRYLNYPPEETQKLDRIRKFYFNSETNLASTHLIQNYTNLISDRHFFVPSHQFVKHYSTGTVPVRMYYFTYQGKFSLAPILAASQRPYFPVFANIILDMIVRWVKTDILGMAVEHLGVCHGDDIPYFFQFPVAQELTPSSDDFTMSRDLISLWTAFASNRKSLNFRGQEWNPVKSQQLRYLQIDSVPKMIDEPFADRVKFWESLETL